MRFGLPILIFILSFTSVFGYSDETTHPALTDEVVDLYNLRNPNRILSDSEKGMMKRGSTDEDDEARWMHHFYDPVYDRGLWGFSPSIVWANDTLAQGGLLDRPLAGTLRSYFGADTDHTWQRAIYEYAWGDKERAMYDLGHVLHLIEDASVPDHTRNDPHPHFLDDALELASPYEMWTAQFTPENFDGVGEELFRAGKNIPRFDNLESFFLSIAEYSNGNFFSKDTTPDFNKDYKNPKIKTKLLETLSNGKIALFAYHSIPQDFFRLALVNTNIITNEEHYLIKDNDRLILTDYWDRLSRAAVVHGAGVVELFFDEVEREKESKILYNKNKSWFARIYNATAGSIFGVATGLYGTSLNDDALAELNNSSPQPPPLTVRGVGEEENISSSLGGGVINLASEELREDLVPTVQRQESNFESHSTDTHVGVGNEEGVGGDEENSFLLTKGEGEEGGQEETNLAIGLPSDELRQPFWYPPAVGNSPGFGGGGSSSDIGAGETDTPGVSIGVGSEEEESSEPADITPPDISFFISGCDSANCLVVRSTLSLSWSATSTDLSRFSITCTAGGSACNNFSYASTTATSTQYTLPTDEKTYIFSAKAVDTAENESIATAITIEYNSMPVVINEVAWGGTAASSADEWIELYNRTNRTISLDNWLLYTESEAPYISLSGTISANDYYLLERKDDNTVSDILADLIYGNDGSAWALNNTGEVLTLAMASTTVDQTVLCGGNWCGGAGSPTYETMERINPDTSGAVASNWGTAKPTTVARNGKDADGVTLAGSAKARNSLNYLIAQGDALSSDKTLTKALSPYIVPTSQDFTVAQGATLIIEPGVIIKMGDQASMTVKGDISASGTSGEKIIFTSIDDDPSPGAWKYLRVESPSSNSTLSYVTFEYGGRYFGTTPQDKRAMVSIYQTTTTLSNLIFENSQIAGLRATDFYGTISGSTFGAGTTTADHVGLYIQGGAPTISGNTFSQNYKGLYVESSVATTTISNSTFSNNYIGLGLTVARASLDTLIFTDNTAYGIQLSNSTLLVLNPASIIFSGNGAGTTSPAGLF